jgi:peptidoglycan/LPS O-acetylase OafA/YrhL
MDWATRTTRYKIWSMDASQPASSPTLVSGVDLFFVMSGCVMIYSSERLFEQTDAPGGLDARLRSLLQLERK